VADGLRGRCFFEMDFTTVESGGARASSLRARPMTMSRSFLYRARMKDRHRRKANAAHPAAGTLQHAGRVRKVDTVQEEQVTHRGYARPR
jgi:hypothetical protein